MVAVGTPMGIQSLCFPHNPPNLSHPAGRHKPALCSFREKTFIGCQFA